MGRNSPKAAPLLIRRAAVLGAGAMGIWTRPEGCPLGSVHSVRRRVTAGTLVSEQYILDLERKTQECIAFTLQTGKPLRN